MIRGRSNFNDTSSQFPYNRFSSGLPREVTVVFLRNSDLNLLLARRAYRGYSYFVKVLMKYSQLLNNILRAD